MCNVDYRRPVEALIPGVHGRVLGVLARTESEMTIRTVARLAAASPQQASVVVAHLVDLGVVSRRDAGSSALVRLERNNATAQLVLALARLQDLVMDRLSESARGITPAPASLLVFGSFARGEATDTSDLDVLAVRPEHLEADASEWVDALGSWQANAQKIVGNQVNLLVVSIEEVPALLRRRGGPWRTIAREGIPLVGPTLPALHPVA